MATSSLSRDFIISDDKSIDKLIEAMENPTPVKIERDTRSEAEKAANLESVLCKIKARLALQK